MKFNVLTEDKFHSTFNYLENKLSRKVTDPDEPDFELNIVNSSWGQIGFNFKTDYLDVLAVNYGASMNLLDFFNYPNDSRIIINDWVEAQTKEKIKDLLPVESICLDTKLVLVNAIYMYGAWATQFYTAQTTKESFVNNDNSKTEIDMMSNPNSYKKVNYKKHGTTTIFDMPFKNKHAKVTIFLPDSGTFDSFENSFNKEYVEEATSEMDQKILNLKFPKFKLKPNSISIKKTLKALGMSKSFSGVADFSGITETSNLVIDDVFHKAFISFDETGCEAAAATAIIIVEIGIDPSEVENITVNRPFVFTIQDYATSSILFMGSVKKLTGN